MATWDDEDFEPAVVSDKWDGEDEDDDEIKDNWDDDEDESAKKTENVPAPQPKKNKSKAERIAEKQEERRKELQKKQEELQRENEEQEKLTPEEQLATKLKNQKLQEEADLALAMETFGVEAIPGLKTIDNFHPTNKEEFLEFANMITKKLVQYETESEYVNFLETLFRDCLAGVDSEQIKRISSTLNILATEKQKLAKSAKGGKKKASSKKTALSSGKGTNKDMDYEDDFYNEYEDFM